jgi:hypothetical protein
LIFKDFFDAKQAGRPAFRKSGRRASEIPDKKMPSSRQEGIFNQISETLLFVGFG